jgi:hypothetical protein
MTGPDSMRDPATGSGAFANVMPRSVQPFPARLTAKPWRESLVARISRLAVSGVAVSPRRSNRR